MSNPLAIAATTATFAHFLTVKVREERALSGIDVSMVAPDVAQTPPAARKLNLFLYQVQPNAALANDDLPFRNAAGDLIAQPRLALNLHYLLTAYGQDDHDPDAHHLLGQAMSVVHDNGVIARAQIREALTAYAWMPELLYSDLADQIEPIKLSPLSLSTEDLFRLWSVFGTKYRISVAYVATVVVTERPRETVGAAPVRRPSVQAVTMRRPVIESVNPVPAFAGQMLTISGRNLYSPAGTFVRFATGDVPVVPPSATDRRIDVALPSGLRPGTNVVAVAHELQLGPPGEETPHRGFQSDPAPFTLAPVILTGPPPTGTPVLQATIARGASLELGVSPQIRPSQRTVLMLGSHALPRHRPLPSAGGPLAEPDPLPLLTFQIPPAPAGEIAPQPADAIAPGMYTLRIVVDAAQSPLERHDIPGWTPPQIQVT